MAVISGTAGNDTIVGTADADVIDAGDGIDKVNSGTGDDIVYGGLGNDNINGEVGHDKLFGGAGNDILTGHSGMDEIYGEDGNDGVYGGGDADRIWGAAGNDTLIGDGGDDAIDGGADNDKLFGGVGNDTLYGGTGTDILNGEAGNDTLVVRAGEGADTINGGAGMDSIVLDVAAGDVSAAFRADVAAYSAWMDGLLAVNGGTAGLAMLTTGATFTFGSVGLTMSLIEGLTVKVDGVAVPLSTFLNEAPIADATASLATDEDAAVSGQVSATDADGDTLTWTLGQGPSNGTLSLDGATGTYTYTPGTNFNGSDTFSITVADPSGEAVTQVITVGVAAVNDAPVTDATGSLSTSEDAPVSGEVVASDVDGDGLSYSLSGGPAHGVVTLNVQTGAYEYVPTANFSGSDAFEVTVSDGNGGSATQRIEVAVAAIADDPSLTVAHSLGNSTSPANGNGTHLGGNSDDTLVGGEGHDRISGSNGNDTLYGDGTPSVTVALSIAAALADLDGSESLSITVAGMPVGATLSAGHDNGNGSWTLGAGDLAGLSMTLASAQNVTLSVTATSTEATGGSASVAHSLDVTFTATADGNDTLVGGAGNDTLVGGGGDDVMYGGSQPQSWIPSVRPSTVADDDIVHGGDGNDTIYGGNGNDVLTGDAGNDKVFGGKGNDRLEGGDGNDTLKGDSGNDVLEGGAGNDKLTGSTGHDTLDGGSGNDALDGGSGNDMLRASSGNDSYAGGSGVDTLDYSSATGAISVDVSKKTVTGFGSDTMSGIEKIVGSSFADFFKGGSDADIFFGGAGDDTFRGMEGADTMSGGAGADTWQWFAKDVLQGNKHLGVDTITDFGAGDRLDLTEFTKAFRNAPIDTIVHLDDRAQGSMLSVKVGSSFVDLVMLEGVHNVDASDLVADGMILA